MQRVWGHCRAPVAQRGGRALPRLRGDISFSERGTSAPGSIVFFLRSELYSRDDAPLRRGRGERLGGLAAAVSRFFFAAAAAFSFFAFFLAARASAAAFFLALASCAWALASWAACASRSFLAFFLACAAAFFSFCSCSLASLASFAAAFFAADFFSAAWESLALDGLGLGCCLFSFGSAPLAFPLPLLFAGRLTAAPWVQTIGVI